MKNNFLISIYFVGKTYLNTSFCPEKCMIFTISK